MEYTLLILLLPLLSFLLIGVVDLDIPKNGRVWSPKVAGIIGTASLAAVTVLSYVAAFQYFTGERLADGTFPTIVPYNFTWLPLGSLHFDLGVLLDPISVMMLVVISTVSLMVHIYTIGYMADEKVGYQRFFSYISLFTFSMLMLIMSNNFIQLFFGWEAVGLVSYLLIGFYFKRDSAIFANLKAFLVNRVGDFGFVLGIGLVLAYFGGSLRYADVFAYLPNVVGSTLFGWDLITITCLLLFVGAMGKSAQFPLHVLWCRACRPCMNCPPPRCPSSW